MGLIKTLKKFSGEKLSLYEKFTDKLEDIFRIIPYNYRPSQIWYYLKCFFWHRYSTVKPRTLPGHGWVDRDHLLAHCCFEILTQFMEKEVRGYKEEDYAYFHTEQPNRLIDFGGHKKDPYYVLDYLYRWWPFYLEKSEKCGDAWYNHTRKHRTSVLELIENTKLFSYSPEWDSEENKQRGNVLFKRYLKKEEVLDKELQDNLLLLISLKGFLWT